MRIIWVFKGYGNLPCQDSNIFKVIRDHNGRISVPGKIYIKCDLQGLPHNIELEKTGKISLDIAIENELQSIKKTLDGRNGFNDCIETLNVTNMLEIVSRNIILLCVLEDYISSYKSIPKIVYIAGYDKCVFSEESIMDVTGINFFKNNKEFIMITKKEYKKYLASSATSEMIVIENGCIKYRDKDTSHLHDKFWISIMSDTNFVGQIETSILEFIQKNTENVSDLYQ